MSRIGNQIIEIPKGVEVKREGNLVSVKGPKGEVSREISPLIQMTLNEDDQTITFSRDTDQKEVRSLHGTTRSLVNNMIVGVSEGFSKELELVGVGYRAQMQGSKLVLNLGLSHPVEFEAGENVDIEVPEQSRVIVKGIDKEAVGALAANIRATRVPEPYKGKGVRYKGEHVRRKEGKTGK